MDKPLTPSRRKLLKLGASSLAALSLGPSLLSLSLPVNARSLAEIGPLLPPDRLGIRLPKGFSARLVAESGKPASSGGTAEPWHIFPDGGATFPSGEGGWIYVSNSETSAGTGGGVSALRFNAQGGVVDNYRILAGTNRNCAGGPTPWQSWLSCEEVDFGRVFECDPEGRTPAVARPALGYFKHEAVAVDPVHGHIYLTEDETDGRFYRYVPHGQDGPGSMAGKLNLSAGRLQVAVVGAAGQLSWIDLPNPAPSAGPASTPRGTASQLPTRYQIAASTPFNGGEGIWYHGGNIYFTTKGDNRVWHLDIEANRLAIVYDAATAADPLLTGVDNITVSAGGDLLVAEDGGDMQIVVIDAAGKLAPLLQIVGQDQSEITGPAFSPDGSRLYFSSQRGGVKNLGLTYEVTGPFAQFFA